MNAVQRVAAFLGPIQRRTYATRTHGRPLPRPRDPLSTSTNAVINELQPGVTFIHRPPPSAPSPHSLTVAPASPLLRPRSVLSNSAPTFTTPSLITPNASTPAESSLPPLLRPNEPPKPSTRLTEPQIEEMRALRLRDPRTYTVGVLAKQFDCSPGFVQLVAPLTKGQVKARLEKREKDLANWSEGRKTAAAIRSKRRSLW